MKPNSLRNTPKRSQGKISTAINNSPCIKRLLDKIDVKVDQRIDETQNKFIIQINQNPVSVQTLSNDSKFRNSNFESPVRNQNIIQDDIHSARAGKKPSIIKISSFSDLNSNRESNPILSERIFEKINLGKDCKKMNTPNKIIIKPNHIKNISEIQKNVAKNSLNFLSPQKESSSFIETGNKISLILSPYNSEQNDDAKENNFDDFLILNDKYEFIKKNLSNSRNVSNLCYEWWNYSNFCNFKENLKSLFFNSEVSQKLNIFQDAIILETLSMICIYQISFDNQFPEFLDILNRIIETCFKNWHLLTLSFVNRHSISPNDRIKFYKTLAVIIDVNVAEIMIEKTIKNNNQNIFNLIKELINNYKNLDFSDNIAGFLLHLRNCHINKINDFFKTSVIKTESLKSHIIKNEENKQKELIYKDSQEPYIKISSKNKYTLLLDLDETLIHFRFNNDNSGRGTTYFRPGLFEFLDEMEKYYELIIFTCATKSYANNILEQIEKDKKYFDFKLFREHNLILGGEYIKDISRIGRNLSTTLIIDNTPQNFRLQKANGIFIQSFYDNPNDKALFELIPILRKIALNNPDDIRKELNKSRSDIVRKVSMSIK